MSIDFTPVENGEIKLGDLANTISIDDLRHATNESVDLLLEMVRDLNDEDIVFDPVDPNANDPYATKGEEEIGWSIGHLIAHVTASSEEGAAFASVLGRGITIDGRLRYETPWREMTTQAGCVQRLEESRKIRLAYLDALPETPHLNIYRNISERFEERVGKLNAYGAFLLGLAHERNHYQQIKDVIAQTKAA